jgi:hypothetical protein
LTLVSCAMRCTVRIDREERASTENCRLCPFCSQPRSQCAHTRYHV